MIQNKFDDFQIDQLKEIMNIGASHASTALSQMVGHRVGLSIPHAYIDNIDNVKKYFNGSSDNTKAALIKVFGDIKGLIYFIFSHENEDKLIHLLLKNVTDDAVRREMELSVITEVGNILAGASLTAFSKFLDMTLLHSVSNVFDGTLDDVVGRVADEMGDKTELALIFQIDFNIKSEEISTHFLFFIDAAATQQLLDGLERKYKK